MNEMDLFAWLDGINYRMMQFTTLFWWPILATLLFLGSLFRMVPFQMHHTHSFTQVLLIYLRRTIFWGVVVLVVYPLLMLFLYLMVPTTPAESGGRSPAVFWQWLVNLARANWTLPVNALASGILLNILCSRYLAPVWSALMRKIRVKQFYDVPSDIRNETARFQAKRFVPKKYYKQDATFIGLDAANRPIHVPLDTWHQTNMQIIGPTRFGKGVILGTLMDQAIRRGDAVVYIDPKEDTFAPHILYQACVDTGRPFYYLTLHDQGVGSWAPFAGGALRDGLNRLELSFGLELTGDAGSDFYKSQERRLLERAFAEHRDIQELYRVLEETEARRILAELAQWRALRSLCPAPGDGFDVARALQDDAVVYVQGHLFDSVVKAATKAFIVELIQESRRLARDRHTHLTVAVDEVSFLTSKPLAQALATSVGFQCNFILAYQSQNDLLNLDDRTLNPRYIYQSINVNSQLKAVYAGADRETAEWAASLSGTIVKDITKLERTEINETGGESFEKQRMLGSQEEPYIHPNQILSLPPRVFVFFQPAQLATIGFCSPVGVKDERDLNGRLAAEAQREAAVTAIEEPEPVREESPDVGSQALFEDMGNETGSRPTPSPGESGTAHVSPEKRPPTEPDADGVHLLGLAHWTDLDDDASSSVLGEEGLHDRE